MKKKLPMSYDDKYIEQRKTVEDVLDKLEKYGVCAVLRPTGFGKTYMMTTLISCYDKVLYLYPAAIIKNTVVDIYTNTQNYEQDMLDEDGDSVDADTKETAETLKHIPNCTLMSYAKLTRLSEEDFENMNYDLILFDEMHRLGGPKTKDATYQLFEKNPNAHFVGATATPTRMDNFDPVAEFFNNKMCYPFTLHDAIEAGMIQKPNYVYCTTNVKDDIENTIKKESESLSETELSEIIDAKVIEAANLFNMDKIIKDTCDKFAKQTDSMKFIVFFSNIKHMNEKLTEVINWFQSAYPTHNIKTLKISSASTQETKNVDDLLSLTQDKKTIYLIACIDMLNMGYHISNLTGILMYRGTKSSTIFIQQLGRALSAGSDNSSIVIDVVNNLNRKAVYELQQSIATKRIRKPTSKTQDMKKETKFFVSKEDNSTIMTYGSNGNIIKTQFHMDENKNILDNKNNQSVFEYNPENEKIYEIVDLSGKDTNTYMASDFNMTGHEATYREFLAKALAEPLTQRCKYAFEVYYKTWLRRHGVNDYPITVAELRDFYKIDRNDFFRDYCEFIKSHNIVTLQDANEFITMIQEADNSKDSDYTLLKMAASTRNVSINQILDLLKIA